MDNFFVWDAMISGPEDSLWEGGSLGCLLLRLGGMFKLYIRFPEDYPSSPPSVRFTTPIFHPNGITSPFVSLLVFSDGNICLDTIKECWSPVNTISTVLTSIQVSKCA